MSGEVEIRDVEPGQHVLGHDGVRLRVMTSEADQRTAHSSTWEIVAIADGYPTRRIAGDPSMLVEVVETELIGARCRDDEHKECSAALCDCPCHGSRS